MSQGRTIERMEANNQLGAISLAAFAIAIVLLFLIELLSPFLVVPSA